MPHIAPTRIAPTHIAPTRTARGRNARGRNALARNALGRSAKLALLLLCACSQDFKLAEQLSSVTVTPLTSDAGVVATGSDTTLPLTLYATNGDVQVISVDLLNQAGDWFSLVETEMPLIESDGTATLTVRYEPGAEGLHWAHVTVNTNAGDGVVHSVDVRGEAATPQVRMYPTILDFGPVQTSMTVSQNVTVENQGRAPLTLADVEITNPRFSTVTPMPIDVAIGETITLTFTYEGDDQTEQTGAAALDLGASIGPLTLRANACSTASGDLYDTDSDGFSFCAGDCDDWDADINANGLETCDGADQDCDGSVDEGTSCVDDDGDGLTEDDGDCNDGDDAVSPIESEVDNNGIDDDCDGLTDDGTVDGDSDGYSRSAGDCDDTDPDVYPGAPESADGADNDCDSTVDEGTSVYDDDADGYTEAAGDCDDSDDSAFPGRPESADWIDNDCDGTVDEGTNSYDDDGDGFTETGGDCDDSAAAVNPGAVEIASNMIDDNCDGVRS